jgi:hypothetical protein
MKLGSRGAEIGPFLSWKDANTITHQSELKGRIQVQLPLCSYGFIKSQLFQRIEHILIISPALIYHIIHF